jgi:hypothetical protein
MLIFGHYLDFYHMVMLEPMAAGAHGEEHGDAHVEEHAVLTTTTVLYAENHEEASTGAGLVDEHAESIETIVDHVVTAEHAEEHSTEGVVYDIHGADTHPVDTHGEAAPLTHAKLGLVELLFFVGFLGMFLFMTFTGLDGEELEIKEDPFLEESLHHHIKFS